MSRSPLAYTSTGVSGTACRTETVAVSAAVAGVATRISAPATPTAPAARLYVRIELTRDVLPGVGVLSPPLPVAPAVRMQLSVEPFRAGGWTREQRPGPRRGGPRAQRPAPRRPGPAAAVRGARRGARP